jgi:hypothetical protein
MVHLYIVTTGNYGYLNEMRSFFITFAFQLGQEITHLLYNHQIQRRALVGTSVNHKGSLVQTINFNIIIPQTRSTKRHGTLCFVPENPSFKFRPTIW